MGSSRPIQFELTADDPERAAAFYTAAFGWTVKKWDGQQDYWQIATGEGEPGIDGGMARRSDVPDFPGTTNTIAVEDIDAALRSVIDAGGTVLMGRTEFPGGGWMAYCQDTEGNAFGVLQRGD